MRTKAIHVLRAIVVVVTEVALLLFEILRLVVVVLRMMLVVPFALGGFMALFYGVCELIGGNGEGWRYLGGGYVALVITGLLAGPDSGNSSDRGSSPGTGVGHGP